VISAGDVSADLSVANFDHITNFQRVARDIDDLAVYQDVAVSDHLPRLENCFGEAESIHRRLEPKLKKTEEVQTRVAVHSMGSFECAVELLLQHSVIAPNDLLRKKLLSIFGLSTIQSGFAVLSSRVRSFVTGALWVAPYVLAHFPANICFSSSIGCHAKLVASGVE
jgi:hypothetical protein